MYQNRKSVITKRDSRAKTSEDLKEKKRETKTNFRNLNQNQKAVKTKQDGRPTPTST